MSGPSPEISPGSDSSGPARSAPRKHRATGNPKGGRRPGAGRPKGAKNVLLQGAVKAIKVANMRVPETASPGERALADRALQRIIDVMEEEVSSFNAYSVLTSARLLREEVCGKVADKHEHTVQKMDSGEVTDEEWTALAHLTHEVRGG